MVEQVINVSSIGYAPHNGLKTETYGNSLVHALSYNNRLQANEIKLGTSGNPTYPFAYVQLWDHHE